MREVEIDKAVAMLQSEKLAKISEEQRNQFLQEKFSQEEISEINRRLKLKTNAGTTPTPAARPIVTSSPQTQSRLDQTNSHFNSWTTALNVASLAIVTSVGVTYLLDKFKDKKDESLRNELKDRLYSTLSENTSRLRQLEIKQDELVSQLQIHSSRSVRSNFNIEMIRSKNLLSIPRWRKSSTRGLSSTRTASLPLTSAARPSA